MAQRDEMKERAVRRDDHREREGDAGEHVSDKDGGEEVVARDCRWVAVEEPVHWHGCAQLDEDVDHEDGAGDAADSDGQMRPDQGEGPRERHERERRTGCKRGDHFPAQPHA